MNSIAPIVAISSWANSQGFIHVPAVWSEGRFVLTPALISALGLGLGIPLCWAILRYAGALGLMAAELQAVAYFAVTIVVVALTSGRFMDWTWMDRGIAVVVLTGLIWLAYRTGA